ncbi:hypothetical protein GCM10012280_21100 [Wenjunlia tyrosinilytica]|uniref:Uncharacterized protein n=1 Tax=Wenjunlia tyrosinilytica TaxID=1544741 RepID=A0A918DX51_9ACTN|nr:hypothetical protein GCM10012280_21100 [Wenjunlia tyrosinilytica]
MRLSPVRGGARLGRGAPVLLMRERVLLHLRVVHGLVGAGLLGAGLLVRSAVVVRLVRRRRGVGVRRRGTAAAALVVRVLGVVGG